MECEQKYTHPLCLSLSLSLHLNISTHALACSTAACITAGMPACHCVPLLCWGIVNAAQRCMTLHVVTGTKACSAARLALSQRSMSRTPRLKSSPEAAQRVSRRRSHTRQPRSPASCRFQKMRSCLWWPKCLKHTGRVCGMERFVRQKNPKPTLSTLVAACSGKRWVCPTNRRTSTALLVHPLLTLLKSVCSRRTRLLCTEVCSPRARFVTRGIMACSCNHHQRQAGLIPVALVHDATAPPKPEEMKLAGMRCMAKQSVVGEAEGSLSFKCGDIIFVPACEIILLEPLHLNVLEDADVARTWGEPEAPHPEIRLDMQVQTVHRRLP